MNSAKDGKKKIKDVKTKKLLRNMSKEALAATIAKKKECDARAMIVVQQCIEPAVDQSWLLSNLKHINQSHFQDIVEERAISKICGYVLCDNPLTDIPSQIYKISTRVNKVYDITYRKYYCSDDCYKAGTFLKEQLHTSPLWIRDSEVPVDYEILNSAASVTKSGAGDEVELITPITVKDNNVPSEQSINENVDTSTPDSKSLHASDNLLDTEIFHSPFKEGNEDIPLDLSQEIPPNKLNSKSIDSEQTNHPNKINIDSVLNHNNCELFSGLNDILEISSGKSVINGSEKKKLKNNRVKTDTDSKDPSANLVGDIVRNIRSWFNLDTLIFLIGLDEAKALLEKSDYSNDIAVQKTGNHSYHLKYQELCKKLNVLELMEEDKQIPTKPLPNYEELKKDTEALEIKVKNFFQGDMKVTFADEKSEDTDCDEPILPLVDHCSVLSSRRRLVLDRLHKVLPDIQTSLNLSHMRLGKELQELVYTFSLTATNITMRPQEWALTSLIIIRLLTLKMGNLKSEYSSVTTQKRLSSFLSTFGLTIHFIDSFVSNLMDINRIMS